MSQLHERSLVNGQPARYDDPVVIVGAFELYEARCRNHHQVPSVDVQDYHEFLDEILITEDVLNERIHELGEEISRDYQDALCT